MGLTEWLCLIVSGLFTVGVLGALVTYVVQLFRSARPHERKIAGKRGGKRG